MASHLQDDEIERPQNMMEMVSGDESWSEVGLRIKWTEPSLPSDYGITLGQPLRLRVCVEAKQDVTDSGDEVSAFCWTNVKFAENKAGMWKDIKLFENPKCRNESPPGVMSLVFCGSLAPVSESAYRVTFNVKWKQFMIWANKFQVDTVLHVTQGNEEEVPLSVPINFPCGQNPAHGDSRDSAMPDPSRMAGSRPSRAGDPLNSSRPPGASIILDGDGAEVPEIAEEPADEEAAAAEPEAPVEAADGEAADAAPAEEGAEEEAVDFEAEADETLRESQEHQDDVEMLVLL